MPRFHCNSVSQQQMVITVAIGNGRLPGQDNFFYQTSWHIWKKWTIFEGKKILLQGTIWNCFEPVLSPATSHSSGRNFCCSGKFRWSLNKLPSHSILFWKTEFMSQMLFVPCSHDVCWCRNQRNCVRWHKSRGNWWWKFWYKKAPISWH